MPNLNLTYSGNMNITSASIEGNQLNVSYEPNNTGAVSGFSFTPPVGSEFVCGDTYTITAIPKFRGTVLTENFTVSGVDIAGVQRSDTSALKQPYDTNLTHYELNLASVGATIISSSVTSDYLELEISIGNDEYAEIDIQPGQGGVIVYPIDNITDGSGPDTGDTGTVASSLTLVVADSITGSGIASAVWSPSGATVSLRYQSNSPAYATIDPVTGEITVLQTGDVRFTVFDDITGLFDSKVVHCYKEGEGPDTGTVINFLAINVPAYIWDTGYVGAQYSPDYAEVDLHYTSNLPGVASVDEFTGEVTVHQTGNVTFCVTDTRSGLSDCMPVNVGIIEPDTGVSATAITIVVDDVITDTGLATAIVEPSNANVNLYYTYEDTEIIGANTAAIDRYTGQINVRRTGTARFCVEDRYTGLKDCKVVNVVKTSDPTKRITAITLNVEEEIVGSGVAYAIFQPEDATVSIVFTSSDTNIATIDNNGNIEVIRDGVVTFCATDLYTNLSDCKTVNVFALDSNCRVGIHSLKYVTDGTRLSASMTCDAMPDPFPTWEYTYRTTDASIAEPVVLESDTNDIVSVHQEGYVSLCVDENETETSDCMRTYALENGVAPTGKLRIWYDIYDTNRTYTIAKKSYSENNRDISAAYLTSGYTIPEDKWNIYKFQSTGKTEIDYSLTRNILTSENFSYNRSIYKIIVPDGVRGIINHSFDNCVFLSDVVLPSSCTIIGDWAFASCYFLYGINLSKVEYIGDAAFVGKIGLIPNRHQGFENGTKLHSIALGECRKIGKMAFADNQNLKTIYFTGNNVLAEIGANAFQGTGIGSIILPNSVVRIDDYAFGWCSYLSAATIGTDIQYVGKNIFKNSDIGSLTIKATVPPTIESDSFSGGYPIYVPCQSVDAYKAAYPDYAYRIQCKTITGLTLYVNSDITNSGSAYCTYTPSDAEVNIEYSSSNTDIATVDNAGHIQVLQSGSVNICATELRTGLSDCKTITARRTATALTINVPDTIVDNGVASATYTPTGSTVELVYSIYDSPETSTTAATIDANTGKITVVDDGEVWFMVYDQISGLSDRKKVTVMKQPQGVYIAKYNVTSTGDTLLYQNNVLNRDFFVKAELEGYGEITLTKDAYGIYYYSFPTTGIQTLYLTEVDPGETQAYVTFSGATQLVEFTYPRVPKNEVGIRFAITSGRNSCGVKKITFPDEQTSLTDMNGLQHLETVVLPTSVTYSFTTGFYDCVALTGVTIPDSYTFIPNFSGCTSLQTINIPSGVTSLDASLFRNCTSLASIYSHPTTAPTIQSSTFRGVGSNGTLYYPSGSNYNTWLGTGNYYLGKYGWTGSPTL